MTMLMIIVQLIYYMAAKRSDKSRDWERVYTLRSYLSIICIEYIGIEYIKLQVMYG